MISPRCQQKKIEVESLSFQLLLCNGRAVATMVVVMLSRPVSSRALAPRFVHTCLRNG